MHDFPDSKELLEYADWEASRTKAHASAFITTVLECNWEQANRSDVYLKYIATRPRVERLGSHGLFGDDDIVDLQRAAAELDSYTGNVWTHIISLKREDAARLGYDHASAWRDLLRQERNEIAAAMNIPPDHFRWYAAFHDEGNHPHVHMMAWSSQPKEGWLDRDGPLVTPDWVEARYWFEQAAQTLPDTQYALGKLLLADDVEVHDREQGIRWLTQAAESGHEFAAYRLAKELLKDGNVTEALPWLTMSAEADNPYAEYLLGKLHWEGEDIPQGMEQAVYWLTRAAEQGHTHAQILLERQDSPSLPFAILAVNSLLHSIGRIFQDNAHVIDGTHDQHTDRKLRRRIQEKKIAMGHKPNDHEEQGWGGMTM